MIVDEADDMLRGNSMEGLIALFGGTSGKGDKGLLNSILDTFENSDDLDFQRTGRNSR